MLPPPCEKHAINSRELRERNIRTCFFSVIVCTSIIFCFICFPPEVFFHLRVIGACPVTTDCIVAEQHLLSGVLSEWGPVDMQWKKTNQTKNHHTYRWQSPTIATSPGLSNVQTQRCHVPENCGGFSIRMVYNTAVLVLESSFCCCLYIKPFILHNDTHQQYGHPLECPSWFFIL